MIISLTSCTSTVNTMKPLGEDCLVTTEKNIETAGELLMADNSEVVLLCGRRLERFPLEDVRRVYIRKFSLQKEKTAAFVPVIIFDLIVGIPLLKERAAASIFLYHAGLSFGAIKLSNPKVTFKKPFSAKNLEQLKLYARYPQGLSPEQREELNTFYETGNF